MTAARPRHPKAPGRCDDGSTAGGDDRRMTTITASGPATASERIVEACLAYAERMRFRGITMHDLCAVAGMSERRVRHAFYECSGVSPTAYLRTTALREVRGALLDAPGERDAVTRAATDFGFHHLSRFAGQYRSLFGECPSATVARARMISRS
jgi:AraC family ethanolamine operon transcriptional activator